MVVNDTKKEHYWLVGEDKKAYTNQSEYENLIMILHSIKEK